VSALEWLICVTSAPVSAAVWSGAVAARTCRAAETGHRQKAETNLLGAMTATEVFLDQLRDGGCDLVNISSVAGRTAPAGQCRLRRRKDWPGRLAAGAAPGTAA
jgi:NAD(P)-dependent dehydrogenase (short-subunit alcohol dehydrogenase family)